MPAGEERIVTYEDYVFEEFKREVAANIHKLTVRIRALMDQQEELIETGEATLEYLATIPKARNARNALRNAIQRAKKDT